MELHHDLSELERQAVALLAENTPEARRRAAQLLTQKAYLEEQARIDALAERPARVVVLQLLGEGEGEDDEFLA